MAGEWNIVIREVASRMNAIYGPQSGVAESSYLTIPNLTSNEVKDASYHYSMLVDACANAEQIIANSVAMTTNHPWRHVLYKGQLNGAGSGLASGAQIYLKANSAVTDCLSLGPVTNAAADGPPGKLLRETPIEDIQRRMANSGNFFQKQVYFYRIQDDRIYHTQPAVFIDYYGYDREIDTMAKIPTGTILFPHTAIPAYVAGALSLLLKEEEYAGQCQYYGTVFAGLMQQIINGFGVADPMGAPAPVKGTEST